MNRNVLHQEIVYRKFMGSASWSNFFFVYIKWWIVRSSGARSSYVCEFIIIVGLGIGKRSGVARDFQSNHEKRQKKTTDFALKEINRQ